MDGSATSTGNALPGDPNSVITFRGILPDSTDDITLADGYSYKVLSAWGDPVEVGAPTTFNLEDMSKPSIQNKTFGYNCDYNAFLPLPVGSTDSSKGLWWNNHEYVDPSLMYRGFKAREFDKKTSQTTKAPAPTKEQVEAMIEAHGGSILEVESQADGHFKVNLNGALNRRITGTTEMEITGPAAADEKLRTAADPSGGSKVLGTFNNCGGGYTPWGTFLTCEENYDRYFANAKDYKAEGVAAEDFMSYTEIQKGPSEWGWEQHVERFDLAKHPNEFHRFGYVVEVDPSDKNSKPKKRSALGRFKHESATVHTAKNGKVVVYTGDDQVFEFVYKFVSDGTVSGEKASDTNLLDKGTLYVAKFSDDGTGRWLPLKHGEGKLTAPAFRDQAEVLIFARAAARAVGATPMDRPEDVEVSPTTGKVYFAMTKNSERGGEGKPPVDKANPRKKNSYGHLIEITEDDGDHSTTSFKWEIPLLCGDPKDTKSGVYYGGLDPRDFSSIACPDNLCFSKDGLLWIVTDGQPGAFKTGEGKAGQCDGLFAMVVDGPQRGLLKQLLSAVPDSEVTGPFLTPDEKTMFVSIQHPGEESKLEKPSSMWPDVSKAGTPRPAVITIVNAGGNRTISGA